MRIGVIYELRNPPNWFQPWPRFYAEALQHAEEMDRLGFEVLSFAEHHGDTDGFDPAVTEMTAAAAVRTKRARIGTNIIQTAFHHPVNLAEQLAVVDILSDGRLEAGFAPGQGRISEHRMFGIPLNSRFSRHTEAVEIIRRCWTEEGPFSHQGKHWQLNDVWINPKPVQRPPHTFVTGMGPGSMGRAAQLGYNVMGPGGGHLIGGPDREAWTAWRAQWQAALDAHGRRPGELEASTFGAAFITDDPEKAWAEYEERIRYSVNYETGGAQPYRPAFGDAISGQAARLTFCTPEQAIEKFRTAFAESAPEEFLVRAELPGMSWEASMEFLRNFAEKVLPHIKDIGTAS